MRRNLRAVSALAAFELRRLVRAPRTVVAAVCFLALLALGHWMYWTTPPPRPEDARLFGYGYLIFAVLACRLGIGLDRRTGTDELVAGNLAPAGAYLAGKVLALAAFLACAGATAFAAALLLSAGDVAYAAWYAVLFTLVAWLFVPAVLAVELLMATTIPGVVAVVGFVGVAAVFEARGRLEALVEALGLGVDRLDFESLEPLALRAVVAVPLVLWLLYPLARRRVMPDGRPPIR